MPQSIVIKGFVDGVSAAATGAIAGASYVLALRALVELWTLGIALATLTVLMRWKISELWLIAAVASLGLIVAGDVTPRLISEADVLSSRSLAGFDLSSAARRLD